MPPQRSSSKRGGTKNGSVNNTPLPPYSPSPDAQTYRDLLIFEERLKQNAARLHTRKKKYETLLAVFVSFVLFLSFHVFVRPKESVPLHYFIVSLLMICLTTLFLFFASGMHAERIRAANKFVPQANRSLRSFNMYLNTRIQPRRRSFFSYFYPSSPSSATTAIPPASGRPSHGPASSTAATGLGNAASTGSGVPPRRSAIPPIPPAQNPRGELIFSTRVSTEFRDGYERYRAAFERRRSEKMAAKRAQSWKRWIDYLFRPFRSKAPVPASLQPLTQEAKIGKAEGAAGPQRSGEARRKRTAASRKGKERQSASSIESVLSPSDAEMQEGPIPAAQENKSHSSAASSEDEAQSDPRSDDEGSPTTAAVRQDKRDAEEAEQMLLPPEHARSLDTEAGTSAVPLGPDWIEVKRSGSRTRAHLINSGR